MIRTLLTQLMTMGITGSLVILLILLLRLLLRRAPKIFSYVLWAVALARLLVPISIEAPVSVIPVPVSGSNLAAQFSASATVVIPVAQTQAATVTQTVDHLPLLFGLWLIGAAVMALWGLVGSWRLERRLRCRMRLTGNVYLADHIASPFVAGLLRPKIYLPSDLAEEEYPYILAHERHHIRRFDHVIRFLAYTALCLHWYNPLVWIAFRLSARDMEMSCDEAVLEQLGRDIRCDYSASLLNLARQHSRVAWSPVAFGETSTAARIKHVLKWKRPALRYVLLAALICGLGALSALTDPVIQEAVPRLDQQSFMEVALPSGWNYDTIFKGSTSGMVGLKLWSDVAPNTLVELWYYKDGYDVSTSSTLSSYFTQLEFAPGTTETDGNWTWLLSGCRTAVTQDDGAGGIVYHEVYADAPNYLIQTIEMKSRQVIQSSFLNLSRDGQAAITGGNLSNYQFKTVSGQICVNLGAAGHYDTLALYESYTNKCLASFTPAVYDGIRSCIFTGLEAGKEYYLTFSGSEDTLITISQ